MLGGYFAWLTVGVHHQVLYQFPELSPCICDLVFPIHPWGINETLSRPSQTTLHCIAAFRSLQILFSMKQNWASKLHIQIFFWPTEVSPLMDQKTMWLHICAAVSHLILIGWCILIPRMCFRVMGSDTAATCSVGLVLCRSDQEGKKKIHVMQLYWNEWATIRAARLWTK